MSFSSISHAFYAGRLNGNFLFSMYFLSFAALDAQILIARYICIIDNVYGDIISKIRNFSIKIMEFNASLIVLAVSAKL